MSNPTTNLAPITTGQLAASPYPYAALYRDDDEPVRFVVCNIRVTLPDGSWQTVSEEFETWDACAARCISMNQAWIAVQTRAIAAGSVAA